MHDDCKSFRNAKVCVWLSNSPDDCISFLRTVYIISKWTSSLFFVNVSDDHHYIYESLHEIAYEDVPIYFDRIQRLNMKTIQSCLYIYKWIQENPSSLLLNIDCRWVLFKKDTLRNIIYYLYSRGYDYEKIMIYIIENLKLNIYNKELVDMINNYMYE